MKFLNLSVLLLFLTACDLPSPVEQSAKAVVEDSKNVFDLNNKEVIDEAVMMDRLQVRGKLTYIPNTEEPYSGFAKLLFDDGQLRYLIKFKNGYISAVKSWRTDGSAQKYFEVKELEYDVDDFSRRWKDDSYTFWTEGTKIFRKVVLWHENSEVESVQFFTTEGQFDGKIEYFKNGQKSIQTEMKEGLVCDIKSWKPNGEPAEEAVVDGNGKVHIYYYNGNLRAVELYEDGKVVGEAISYHENGSISYKLTYKDGKPDGETISYHEDGSISSKSTYKDGELNGDYIGYREDGSIIYKETYEDGKLIESP
jgi:antitoxin component YwqK of YwqJK toxin-antitoxin module